MVHIARSKTELTVNGRTYEIYCAPEDLERIKLHGAQFSEMVDELAGALGQIGDVPLFLLACLQLLDELREEEKFLRRYEAGVRHFDVAHNVKYHWAVIIERIAKRIEKIAAEVERQTEEGENALR